MELFLSCSVPDLAADAKKWLGEEDPKLFLFSRYLLGGSKGTRRAPRGCRAFWTAAAPGAIVIQSRVRVVGGVGNVHILNFEVNTGGGNQTVERESSLERQNFVVSEFGSE